MNALIGLVGSKKKANALLSTYLNFSDMAVTANIGDFLQAIDAQMQALEDVALTANSEEDEATIVNRAVRLALVKSSIRSMGGNKVEYELIGSMLQYGLFTPTQAIQTAAQQKYASFTTHALLDLAPFLDPEKLNDALEVANSLNDEYWRPLALATLALHFDDERRTGWVKTLLDETPSPLEGKTSTLPMKTAQLTY